MRWAEAVVWAWLLQAPEAGGDLLADFDARVLRNEIGEQLAEEWKECGKQTAKCPVAELANEVAANFNELRQDFDSRPKGSFNPEACSEFWKIMETKLDNLKTICIDLGEFPPACEQMIINTKDFQVSDRFELAVLCSLIVPGENKTRIPTCTKLAKATISRQRTLTDCASMSKDQCVEHLCDLNTRFRWRMRPYNLQMDYVLDRYSPGFVLQGCEGLENYIFSEEECSNRVDIFGMCDCICGGMNIVTDETCAFTLDSYLLFGRQGVQGLTMSPECETSLCNVFDAGRGSNSCPYLKLPELKECHAYQLPFVEAAPCMWQEHSGEDNVLVCLDGHRCNINEESWSCCYDHRGRGRCPKNLPVMCDILCSGVDTEYCCEIEGECNPRQCSPLLLPYSLTFPATSSTDTTSPFFPEAEPKEEEGFSIRIPTGYWVWLLLIVPVFIGLIFIFFWYRSQKAAMMVLHVKPMHKWDEEQDRLGGFYIVRKPEKDTEKEERKTTIVKVVVDELPSEKPLGLELQELKVIRVHLFGERWGWEEGDVIKSIGGFPVETFEELWARVQVERDRVPCTFEVERELHLVMAQKYAAAPASPQAGSKMQSRVTSKIDGGSRVTSKIDGASRVSSKIEGASRVSSKIEGGTHPSSSMDRSYGLRDVAGDDGQDPMAPEFIYEDVDDRGGTFHEWWTDWDERAELETPSDALPSTVPNWRTMHSDRPVSGGAKPKRKPKPYAGPKFEDEFPVSKPLSIVEEWAAKPKKKEWDPPSQVRYVNDAWGRSIVRIKD